MNHTTAAHSTTELRRASLNLASITPHHCEMQPLHIHNHTYSFRRLSENKPNNGINDNEIWQKGVLNTKEKDHKYKKQKEMAVTRPFTSNCPHFKELFRFSQKVMTSPLTTISVIFVMFSSQSSMTTSASDLMLAKFAPSSGIIRAFATNGWSIGCPI